MRGEMKTKILLLLIVLATCHPVPSKTLAHEGYTPDELLSYFEFDRCIDGDTIKINNSALPDIFGKNLSVRVRGFDSPELRGRCPLEKKMAKKSKDFCTFLFKNASDIKFKNWSKGKFFRVVLDIELDGKDYVQMMINNNMGVEYDGKTKRKNWCKL